MIKKIINLSFIFFMLTLSVHAKSLNRSFNSIIKESDIPASSVSISIKNIKTGHTVYKLNDKTMMHPASVQKLLTIVPIMDILKEDYEFKTALYLRGNNGYIIKLGADPYLTTKDLSQLVQEINTEKVKQIYIDDSIIERKDWGEGWQWDDDLNTSMPRFNSYNLDGNLYTLTLMPTSYNKQALIINQNKIPLAFFNNVITGDKNNIKVSRDNVVSANTLKLEGTVNSSNTINIPNNNLKRYFEFKLTNTLEDKNIYLKNPYKTTITNNSDIFIKEISHPISAAVNDILINSNNMVIETLAKIAAGKYYNKQGTDSDFTHLANDYFQKIGLDNSNIRIVDASGVSKNNLVNADFITEFLIKNVNNKILNNMAEPGQGTLSNRMLPLKNNLKAKTGTLSDTSAIAGFLVSKKGEKYAFAILISNPNSTSNQDKSLENYLIRSMYLNL